MGTFEKLGVPPVISAESRKFWDAAAGGQLVVEYCGACDLHIFPPRGVCRQCRGRLNEWRAVEPPGVLYSYTVNHNPWVAELNDIYSIGLVDFPKFSGVRFVGRLIGFGSEPKIGELVEFSFEQAFGRLWRPCFTPWMDS